MQLCEDVTQCPSFSQPSQDVVKDMIQVSKDTLEKIDKARSEGLYHEVRIHVYGGKGWGGGQKGSLGREEMEWAGGGEATKQVVFLKMSFC